MQVVGVIAGAVLVGLMTLTGFQLVPDASTQTGSVGLTASGPQINVTRQARSAPTLSATEVVKNSVTTSVSINSTQDIERSTATFRGSVLIGATEPTAAFFVYGYDETALQRTVASSDSYKELVDSKHRTVGVKQVARSIARSGEVTTRIGGLAPDTTYNVQLCLELAGSLLCSAVDDFNTNVSATRPGDVRLPTIRIRDENLISASEVEIEASVNMRDAEDGRVYLMYGESERLVSQALSEDEYDDIKEADEYLQKNRLAARVRGELTLSRLIDDLDDETKYYYGFCVSYDGLKDGFLCTDIRSFVTPDEDFGKVPFVKTKQVFVSGATVSLAGLVDMDDFRNGQVFFVYGTDERRIESVGGEMSMQDARQSGDRLQKTVVDADLDGDDSYRISVDGLLPSEQYSTKICVEYKNQNDRYQKVSFVECGEVASFTTQ